MSESGTGRGPFAALGAILQGLGLGLTLFIALVNLLRLSSDAQVFRYQGF